MSRYVEHAERLLAERGRAFGRVRVAAGPSGVVVGFPIDPLVHVSWAALAALVVVPLAIRSRTRRRRRRA